MTLQDFIDETKQRYRTQPLTTATRRSAKALRNGAFRRLGRHIGRPIWDRDDWDVLVVLDTCRTDLWREVAADYDELPTEPSPVWSNASCSIDWNDRNFNGYPDEVRRTGLVTANPFADHDADTCRSADVEDTSLGYFAPLYRTHWKELFDGQIATVTPEDMTDHAIATWRERDALGIDRLVVHYMQPHEPYRARPEWGSGDSKLLENLIDEDAEAGASVWKDLEAGRIDMDEFWAVYKDNLRWVLDDLTERLLSNMDADIVFTADHGNALGELGEWHHPPGAIGPSVRRVPWVSVEGTDSRTANPGVCVGETGSQNPSGVDTGEQLKALGYK